MNAFLLWFGLGFLGFGVWSGQPIVGAFGGLALYWVTVQLHPTTACPKCNGSPKSFDVTGENWRTCGACGGSGKMRRVWALPERD